MIQYPHMGDDAFMKHNDYFSDSNKIFFKHELTKNIPCDAYSKHTHNLYELIYFVRGSNVHIVT